MTPYKPRPELINNPELRTRDEWAEFYSCSIQCIDQVIKANGLKGKCKSARPISLKTQLVYAKRQQKGWHNKAKLTEEQMQFINDNFTTMNMRDLERELNVGYHLIKDYCQSKEIQCKDHKRGQSQKGVSHKNDIEDDYPRLFPDDFYKHYYQGQMNLR